MDNLLIGCSLAKQPPFPRKHSVNANPASPDLAAGNVASPSRAHDWSQWFPLKDITPAALLTGILTVAAAAARLPPSVAKHLIEEAGRCRKDPIGPSTQFGSLTDREVEVLIFVAQRWSNAEIAQRLQATSVTARIDLSPLRMKLDARGLAKAIPLGGQVPVPQSKLGRGSQEPRRLGSSLQPTDRCNSSRDAIVAGREHAGRVVRLAIACNAIRALLLGRHRYPLVSPVCVSFARRPSPA